MPFLVEKFCKAQISLGCAYIKAPQNFQAMAYLPTAIFLLLISLTTPHYSLRVTRKDLKSTIRYVDGAELGLEIPKFH